MMRGAQRTVLAGLGGLLLVSGLPSCGESEESVGRQQAALESDGGSLDAARADGGGDPTAACPPGANVIVGTADDDVLWGTSGRDCLVGLGGNDTLHGEGGNDTIFGGPGNDRLFGGRGKDTVLGGEGDDLVRGGRGKDELFGGPGDDTLHGGNGKDHLFGGPGCDVLDGSNGKDILEGGADNDVIQGGRAPERVRGDLGDDFIALSNGRNSDVSGGPGTDACDYADCEAPEPAACDADRSQRITLDFERDEQGDALPPGTVISNQWAWKGVTFACETRRRSFPNKCLLFGTDHPTGGDFDLGAPNEDFGGPGRGEGGEAGAPGENAEPLHNVLILAENDRDRDRDGLVDSPDDAWNGGWFRLYFDHPVTVETITLLDIDRTSPVTCFNAEGDAQITNAAGLGDNSVQTLALNCTETVELEVELFRSGAIAALTYDGNTCGAGEVCVVDMCVPENRCDACTPVGTTDPTCDGVDDDCDDQTDEDFPSEPTTCGVGQCAATGATSCVDGAVEDSCEPGPPAADDATCDGLDDDCDSSIDEAFGLTPTSCGVGACEAVGTTSCVDGSIEDSCTPGTPAPNDATCDGVDDDCDAQADEDYATESTTCGVGVCAAAGSTSCVSGNVVDSCTPGAPTGDDSVCDGLDNDCDGTADEAYVSTPTSCGVGTCASSGSTSCVGGSVVDSCTPGTPAPNDATCDTVDDDCDGSADEDFPAMSTTCGIGACAATGTEQCISGSVVDNCTPGTPAPADVVCDGIDEDCDGLVDESFASMPTSCGVGACVAAGATSCVAGTLLDSCVPGTPAPDDANCDFIDEDCDGAVDEDAPNAPDCLDENPPTWPAPAIMVTASTRTQATIEWTMAEDDTGVTEYRVFVDGVPVQTVLSPTRTTTITGLVPGVAVEFTVQAADAAGNESVDGPTLIFTPSVVPPDPTTVAPPLDGYGVTPLYDAVSFLFEGPEPIQEGVTPGAIVPERTVVLFGEVFERGRLPLSGVRVSVLDHPEFGFTFTRDDGRFDLVVSGGGPLHLVYERAGFIEAQRTQQTPWERYVRVEDVVLVPFDSNVTQIDLASATTIQVHRGSVIDDGEGARQATLLFRPGTSATLRMPDGSAQPISTLDVRATEFTVGADGPDAMPALMPEHIAFTYAVELSVDQAEAAGASRVEFSEPIPFYVDNFIGLPVGAAMPVGYYDREEAAWIPSTDGLVLNVLSTTGGVAQIDLGGDDIAETEAELDTFGIDAAERETLAQLYPGGGQVWRSLIPHFTPWDTNPPWAPADNAPNPNDPSPSVTTTDEPCEATGSILHCENQTLAEEIPVNGTPFSLRYQSDRVPGRTDGYRLEVPLLPPGVTTWPSEGLLAIQARFRVAGQYLTETRNEDTLDTEGSVAEMVWDGRDAYGRIMPTGTRGEVELCYLTRAEILIPRAGGTGGGGGGGGGGITPAMDYPASFGTRPGDNAIRLEFAREVFTIWLCRSSGPIWIEGVRWDAKGVGLGGFHLNNHHFYNGLAEVFVGGDGTQQTASGSGVFTVAGAGTTPAADGVLAREAELYTRSIAIAPDGTLYLATGTIQNDPQSTVYRIDEAGMLRQVAGDPSLFIDPAVASSGVPATTVPLGLVSDMTFGPDGSLYLAEENVHWVRRIRPDGILEHVAGAPDPSRFGTSGSCNTTDEEAGDQGSAVLSQIHGPNGVLVDDDGTLYITDAGQCRIRRVSQMGIIDSAFSSVAPSPTGTLTLGEEDGDIYFYTGGFFGGLVYRLKAGGEAEPYFGNTTNNTGNEDEGVPRENASLCGDGGVAFDPWGRLLCADLTDRIRAERGGSVFTIAGSGQRGAGGNVFTGEPSQTVPLNTPHDLTVAPDGSLYFINFFEVTRLDLAALDTFPDPNGQVLYRFDERGRHVATVDALTDASLLDFAYDEDSRLSTLTDPDGNVLIISRPAADEVVLTAPFGEQTFLFDDDADGFADRVEYGGDPSGQAFQLAYDTGAAEGLLLSLIDRKGNRHDFEYDTLGRLERDIAPGNRAQTLTLNPVQRSERIEGLNAIGVQTYSVDRDSVEGRTTRYEVVTHADGLRERRVIRPDGRTASMTSFPDGRQVIQRRDGIMVENQLTQDPRFGRVRPFIADQTVTLPGGRTLNRSRAREFEPDPADPRRMLSWTERVTDPRGVTTSTYTRANSTVVTTSPAGRSVESALDSEGRLAEVRVPGFHPVSFAYDARGRIERVSQGPVGQERTVQYEYDANGDGSEHALPEVIRDALNQPVTFTWDTLRQLTALQGPDGETVGFAYDANGNLTGVTPPGRSTHVFDYGDRDEPATYTPPDLSGVPSAPIQWSFDGDFFTTGSTLPSLRGVTPAYDATSGRLTSVTLGRGPVTLGYDATTGRLNQATMPDGQVVTVVTDGHLLEEAIWSGPVSGTVDYTYDDDWRLDSVAVGTASASFGYDDDGLLTSAGGMTLTREPTNGELTGTTVGSVTTTRVVDAFGDVTQRGATWPSGGELTFQDTPDAVGRVDTRTETANGTSQILDYTYDPAGRLTDVHVDGSLTYHYDYDAQGNRVGFSDPSGTETADYDEQDRLTRYGDLTFTYNADGQLETRTDTSTSETTTYDYDELGNLLGVDLPDGTRIDYRIDGFGRRIEKRVDGTPVRQWLYQDGLNPVAELDGSGNLIQLFVYATRGHVPDLIVRGGDTYRVVTDPTGSARRVVEVSTGAVAQALEYDPFGQVLSDSSPEFQPFGFAGGLYDRDTGLTRFGARDYDALIGRWTTKDPILFDGGDTNLYAYAGGDPLNFIDPSGLAVDVVLDVGFIAYDIFRIFDDNVLGECDNLGENLSSLGLDVLGAIIPFATGLGAGARVASRTGDLTDAAVRHLTPQARRSLRSLERRLIEHRDKLDAFKRNPDAFDNRGFLRNAPSEEVRERIIQGRIRHLENEIGNFERQIERLMGGGS